MWPRIYSSTSVGSKFLGTSHTLPTTNITSTRSQITSLASIQQWIEIGHPYHPFTPQCLHFNTYYYYILALHRISFNLPASVSSPNIVSIVLSPLLIFWMLEFLMLDLLTRSYIAFKSHFKTNLVAPASISGPKQFYLCASDSTIDIWMLIFVLKLYHITLTLPHLCFLHGELVTWWLIKFFFFTKNENEIKTKMIDLKKRTK